jgi:hypothetical protein
MIQPTITRAYRLAAPRPLAVEFHAMGCRCDACEPYAPSVAPELNAIIMGKLAVAAVVVTSLAVFLVDPAGAAHALAGMITVGR